MKKLLVFGGTSEEHALIDALSPFPITITLCVASEYGLRLSPQENDRLTIRAGRLDERQIAHIIRKERFDCVIDATHPYAQQVSANVQAAAVQATVPCLRYLREESDTGDAIIVPSVQTAAQWLSENRRRALITTGSKELAVYTQVPDYTKRLYPRVLPSAESIETCRTLGFQPGHIIAMQGPFSRELNIALMQQFNLDVIVTKDGGIPGGFPEKHAAAQALGAALVVVRRPHESGLPLDRIVQRLLEILEEKV